MPEISVKSGKSDRAPIIKLYQKNGLNAVFKPFLLGRGRRTWTLGTRFWRPLLYQLSYTPISILFSRQDVLYQTSHNLSRIFWKFNIYFVSKSEYQIAYYQTDWYFIICKAKHIILRNRQYLCFRKTRECARNSNCVNPFILYLHIPIIFIQLCIANG